MSSKPFTLRLSPELLDRLAAAAAREGIPPSTLAADWIRERLNNPPERLLARALVVAIAALSPDIDRDQAEALVREHFLEVKLS